MVWHTESTLNRGSEVAKSRMNKIKTEYPMRDDGDAFYMSMEEAKQAITDKYTFLQDRYERSKLARKRIN